MQHELSEFLKRTFFSVTRKSSKTGECCALARLAAFSHDSKQSFRSNVRSFNPLEKRGCQGRPAPDRGPGVSPGSFPFSRAACGGAQKERKGFFRGHPEPRQRAGRPLQSRLRSGLKYLEQTFLKFA